MIDVSFQRGIYIPEADLWLDPWDAKPHAFVSHAHADHFARHRTVICSEPTAALVGARFGHTEGIEAQPFHVTTEHHGFRLRMLPAGHIAGSAMLHLTRLRDGATLLYTGDFKMRRGRTAEPVVLQHAETLIMETTFALPTMVFPSALEVEACILRFVHDALHDDETPVLFGYSLGKAQEVLALLHEHDIPCMLHPSVAAMTNACRAMGVDLPECPVFESTVPKGHVLIAPPHIVRSRAIRRLTHARTAMLTGWALLPGASYRYRVDEVIPLSDHADHPGLMECIQRVRPKRVLTLHGYAKEFAAELRSRGIDAWSATGDDQLELGILNSTTFRRMPELGMGRHKRPLCALADFSDLLRVVGETQSRREKIRLLAKALTTWENEEDLRRAGNWLAGRALGRAGRPMQVGGAALRRALLAIVGAQPDRYREISHSQNDAARTARLFLQELSLRPEPLDFAGLEMFFLSLANAPGSLARIQRLTERLTTLHPAEGETVVRLLTGDARIGLKEGLLEEAIAEAFDADADLVRHAHMLTGDPGETAVLARSKRLEEAQARPMVPLKCMLASPEPDADAVAKRFANQRSFWLEPKYDGIRSQLHKKGNEIALYSRDLRRIDQVFPEIIEAARALPGDFIIDGEIIAWAEGRTLGFFDLQKRLGRQLGQGDLFAAQQNSASLTPVRLIAFDLMWRNGVDLLECPLRERRQMLEDMRLPGIFEEIRVTRVASLEEIITVFKEARAAGQEGLIVKDPESFYSPGRRGKSWLKLKGILPTLDCVVVAAEQGHGKRAELLSDYTFAVRDTETNTLRVLGKAYSGLTDEELEELTEHFRMKTVERKGRKHFVEPDVVLEIAFEGIQRSKRHDSGLALRFPRIHALRRDKTVEAIDTLQDAQKLLEN